jgi:uncharacterized protein (TIGR02145 family)
MKLRYLLNCSAIIIFVATQLWAQNTNPIVSNVIFIDSISTTGKVHIYYDVTDAEQSTVKISVRLIKSNEALGDILPSEDPTYNLACTQAVGDIGINIPTGTNKHIIWNFTDEYQGVIWSDYNKMVIANDNIAGGNPCPEEPTIEYAGKIYNTVQIGDQCWLKENLDIGAMINSSVNQSDNGIIEKYCYNNDSINCATYGGLYQWPEIVHYLNGASYDTKPEPILSFFQNLQGICPDGWRLPSYKDYELLISIVNHDANSLKAVGQGEGSGIGTNTSGFSALFNGNWTNFWTSSDGINISNCLMLSGLDSIVYDVWDDLKIFGYGVRCIKGEVGVRPNTPTLLNPSDGETDVVFNPTLSWSPVIGAVNYILEVATTNTFSDIVYYKNGIKNTNQRVILYHLKEYFWRVRATNSTNISDWSDAYSFSTGSSSCPGIPMITYAGKSYNTVQIGDQCWLKENLNVGTMINSSADQGNNGLIEKHCFNNDTTMCNIYGGLYQWEEAMQYTNNYSKNKGICPVGWHIPTASDFIKLSKEVDDNGNMLKKENYGAGEGLGTNESDFSAFSYLNEEFSFWDTTLFDFFPIEAGALSLFYGGNEIGISGVWYYGHKYGNSRNAVRCVRD